IAHAEVDDVLAARPRLGFQVVDDGEDVRGQALDPVELLHSVLRRPAEGCPGIIASARRALSHTDAPPAQIGAVPRRAITKWLIVCIFSSGHAACPSESTQCLSLRLQKTTRSTTGGHPVPRDRACSGDVKVPASF